MSTRIDYPTRARTVARWVLAGVYAFVGVAHLIATDAMVRIVPDWVPHPYAVVIGTGLCELAGAAALMTLRWRRAAGWAFAAYAVCVYPANINHAIHDLGTGTGLSIWYHAIRLPLQPAIVWWALWATAIIDWPFRGRPNRPPINRG